MPKCTRSGWFGLCVSLRQCSQAGKLEQLLSIMQKNSYRCTLAWRWVCTCQELKIEREFVQKQTGSTTSHAQTSSHRRGGEVLTPSNRKTGLFEIPPSLTSTALLICLCISFLFGTPFERTDGFAHQMFSHCGVLHAVRLALNLAPFIREALFPWLSWSPS